VAVAVVLVAVGGVLWLLALIGLLRDRGSSVMNRVVVGVLLAALPPVAAIYWFAH
jgi:hypothetical protein